MGNMYKLFKHGVQVTLHMYVGHWNSTTIHEDTDIHILHRLLHGLHSRAEKEVAERRAVLEKLGIDVTDKTVRAIDTRKPEEYLDWTRMRRIVMVLDCVRNTLQRVLTNDGLATYKFTVPALVREKDLHNNLRHLVMSFVCEPMAWHADNLMDAFRKQAETETPQHEFDMYYLHVKGVRDAMERLVRGHDQWNYFELSYEGMNDV
jgi:hypothetical protein